MTFTDVKSRGSRTHRATARTDQTNKKLKKSYVDASERFNSASKTDLKKKISAEIRRSCKSCAAAFPRTPTFCAPIRAASLVALNCSSRFS